MLFPQAVLCFLLFLASGWLISFYSVSGCNTFFLLHSVMLNSKQPVIVMYEKTVVSNAMNYFFILLHDRPPPFAKTFPSLALNIMRTNDQFYTGKPF